MPDPDRLLNTIERSLEAFQATPGRRGRVVHLQEAGEVMAVGDLHGNLENFRLLLKRADLGRHPRRHLVLQELVHGPFRYATGGEKSHQLVDLVTALKCQYPRQVHLLLGNHELAEWTGQRIGKGDDELNDLFREGVDSAYGSHGPAVYDAYCRLFAGVPLVVRTPHRVFLSHSLPSAHRLPTFNPDILEQDECDEAELRAGGSVHSLLWGRDASQKNAEAFLQKVDADLLITGHIPCDRGFDLPNDRQLILDCMGEPACFCLFPADRPLTHPELVEHVDTL